MGVLSRWKENQSEVPVIMISGHGTIKIAVEATQHGHYDFLQNPPQLNRPPTSLRYDLKNHALQRENRQMRTQLTEAYETIGESPAIKHIKSVVEKVANSNSRVLITGENGTGKELIARALHSNSRRMTGKFVDVNCAAIPAELLESEIGRAS